MLGIAVVTACVLIVMRAPRQSAAWLLLGQFVVLALAGVAQGAADIGYYAEPGSIWRPGLWADLSEASPRLSIGLLAALILVFPTGRLPAGWARVLIWPVAILFPFWFVVHLFDPGRFRQGDEVANQINPLGLAALGHAPWVWFEHTILPIAALTLLATLVSFAQRARASRGDERQQLKIVGLALTVPAFAVLGLAVLGVLDPHLMPVLGDVESFGVITLLPVAVIIAMARYRLYDVDLVVNRTIVYATLSLVLTTVYVIAVLVVGRFVVRAGWTSPWAVAIATLTAAAAAVNVAIATAHGDVHPARTTNRPTTSTAITYTVSRFSFSTWRRRSCG